MIHPRVVLCLDKRPLMAGLVYKMIHPWDLLSSRHCVISGEAKQVIGIGTRKLGTFKKGL